MTTSSFRSTEIVALAHLVLTREFHGPVRMATAQELLHHARLALGGGHTRLASDLAKLAAQMMGPRDGDDAALAAELMQEGGGPTAPDTPAPASRALSPLELRERGVVLEPAPERPRAVPVRLATDGTPRGIPRT